MSCDVTFNGKFVIWDYHGSKKAWALKSSVNWLFTDGGALNYSVCKFL